jgi:uncharacterized protein (DUF697 family)
MVYEVGRRHGYQLDRGHVMEFLGFAGASMTGQVVEDVARKLLGGIFKKIGGRTAGSVAGAATGSAVTFATTYALGTVAQAYYGTGRTLSMDQVRSQFASTVEKAKGMYAQYAPQVEQKAQELDPSKLLSMVRGGASV